MQDTVRKVLLWTPRVIAFAFAAFLSVFALDVFGEGRGFVETLVELLMHLVPTAIIAVLALAAWRREWIGGIAFSALGAFYVITTWGRFPWSVYVVISGPLFLLGVLYTIDWIYRAELRRPL